MEPAVTKVNRGLGLLRDTGNAIRLGRRFWVVAGAGTARRDMSMTLSVVRCVDGQDGVVAVGVEVIK